MRIVNSFSLRLPEMQYLQIFHFWICNIKIVVSFFVVFYYSKNYCMLRIVECKTYYLMNKKMMKNRRSGHFFVRCLAHANLCHMIRGELSANNAMGILICGSEKAPPLLKLNVVELKNTLLIISVFMPDLFL